MRNATISRILAALLVAVALGLPAVPASAGTVDPALKKAISAMKPGEEIGVIVSLADHVPLESWAPQGFGTKASQGAFVRTLRAKASTTQPALLAASAGLGGRLPVPLWAVNAVALTIRSERVAALAHLPGVDTVRLDAVVDAPLSPKVAAAAPTAATAAATTAEWNVNMLRAPDLWAAGLDGTGAVVATLDTGVDPDHADVGPRWRGGTNSWYDPNGQHATPYDASGHGTQAMGLLLGGRSGGTAIGIAPGARWISAKIFNDQGQATVSGIHQAFQWLLDPDGDPSTDDAPSVVNNSWNFPSTVGTCWPEFATDIAVLRAAGIEVVFAAGNDGGASGTSESPANNPGAFPVGAIDSSRAVAPFSGRGPSACDGGTYPEVVAGGVSVKSADLTFGGIIPNSYAIVSGTSFSAPQVAGAFALLAAAHPSVTLASLEKAIRSTTADLGITGPDGDYGYGLPDLLAAQGALASLPPAPVANADAWSVPAGTTLTVAAPGVLANDTSLSGGPLSAALATGPAAGTLSLAADGSFTWVAPAAAGTYGFTYIATDETKWSSPASVSLTVTGGSQPPVAANDAYSVARNSAPTRFAVLSNDSATNATLVPSSVKVVSRPSRRGTATANADGTISYQPARTFRGTETFTYTVRDSLGVTSNAATVTVTVK